MKSLLRRWVRRVLRKMLPGEKLEYIGHGVFSHAFRSESGLLVRIKLLSRGTYGREARICAALRRDKKIAAKIPNVRAFFRGIFAVSMHEEIRGDAFDAARFSGLPAEKQQRFANELADFLGAVWAGSAIRRPMARPLAVPDMGLYLFARKYAGGIDRRRIFRMVLSGKIAWRRRLGVVHGDLHARQIIVDDDFNLGGVIDWDGARRGLMDNNLRRLDNPLRDMVAAHFDIDKYAADYYRLAVLKHRKSAGSRESVRKMFSPSGVL